MNLAGNESNLSNTCTYVAEPKSSDLYLSHFSCHGTALDFGMHTIKNAGQHRVDFDAISSFATTI
jgi:hypothetical protein